MILGNLITPAQLLALRREAETARPTAILQDNDLPNAAERGGTPPRRFSSSAGGPVQCAWYHSAGLLKALTKLTGMAVQATGARGTFSYYDRAGDYLALHRDIYDCDLAVITLLELSHRLKRTSGALCVYPARFREPLAYIRRTFTQGGLLVDPPTGHSVVLLGGTVPHCVLPVAASHRRWISVLCFRLLAGS